MAEISSFAELTLVRFDGAENWTPKMQILYPSKEMLQKAEGKEKPHKDNQHVLETLCLGKH